MLTITVSDRVMVEALRAVQVARLRGQPARRISFRDIDVEQIGYIYEGLLGYSCADVNEVTVGLIGKEGEEPEIPLSALEALRAGKSTDAAFADAILAWVEGTPTRRHPAHQSRPRQGAQRSKRPDPNRGCRTDPAFPHHRPGAPRPAPTLHRHHPPRPAQPSAGGRPRGSARGRDALPRNRRRALHPQVARRGRRPIRPGTPRLRPGPPPARDGWVPVDSDRILDLKVADIACGSGAFLVAAARYLADRLVEAWQREKAVTGVPPHELKTHAIRTVIASCLYGADINAMAVEMCKLSLWLVSLDPKLPFSFVDDKILHGNALLGLTDVRQLKRQHIDPDAAGRAAEPVRGGRGRRAQAGHPAPPAARHRGQRQRPAALRHDQAPPVAASTRSSPPSLPRSPTRSSPPA